MIRPPKRVKAKREYYDVRNSIFSSSASDVDPRPRSNINEIKLDEIPEEMVPT